MNKSELSSISTGSFDFAEKVFSRFINLLLLVMIQTKLFQLFVAAYLCFDSIFQYFLDL